MPLDFQTVSFPIGKGLAQDMVPALIPPGKLIQAQDAILLKDGSIEQRKGFPEMSRSIHGSGSPGLSFALLEHVLADNRETIAITDDTVYTHLEATNDWRDVDAAYEYNINRVISGERGARGTSGTFSVDCAVSNGWAVYAWLNTVPYDGTYSSAQYLYIRMIDLETGAHRDYEAGVVSVTCNHVRVVAVDNYVYVVWSDDSDAEIKAARWLMTDVEAGYTDVVLGTSVNEYGQFDITSRGNKLYLCYHYDVYQEDVLVNCTRVRVGNAAWTVVESQIQNFRATSAGVAEVNRGYCIDADITNSLELVLVAYDTYDTEVPPTGEKSIDGFAVDVVDSMAVADPVRELVGDIEGDFVVQRIAGVAYQAGTADQKWMYVVWEQDEYGGGTTPPEHRSLHGVKYHYKVSTDAWDADYTHRTYHIGLISRPWLVGDDIFCAAHFNNTVVSKFDGITNTVPQRHGYVVQLVQGAYIGGEIPMMVDGQARCCCRIATHIMGNMDYNNTACNVSTTDDGLLFPVLRQSSVDEMVNNGFDLYEICKSHVEGYIPFTVQGELCLTAGVPAIYTGEQLCEMGSHYYPWIEKIESSTSTGSLTPLKMYQWCVVYEWRDNRGVIHRSAPSVPEEIDMPGGHKTASLHVPTLQLSEREDPLTHEWPVRIVIYRTEGDGSIFYREQEVINIFSEPYITVTSTLADTDLRENEILYTDGGALANMQPPCLRHAVVHDQRVWGISRDDPCTLWISKVIQPGGEAPGFSPQLVTRNDVGGAHVALASLGTQIVALKEEGVYVYSGKPPDDTLANNSLNGPIPVGLHTGCVSPKSVVATPSGVAFQSKDSFWMIDRGLNVVRIGGPVEDTVASYPICRGAVLDQEREIVVFVMTSRDGANGIQLVYHYMVGEWTTWAVPYKWGTPTPTGSPPCGAAMCWRGALDKFTLHLCLPSRVLYYAHGYAADTTSYKDYSVSPSTAAAPNLIVSTPWLQFANVAGFQRIRRLHLRGTKLGSAVTASHTLTVQLYYNFATTASHTYSYSESEVAAMCTDSEEHLRIHMPVQKCKAVRVAVMTTGGVSPATGAQVRWETLALEVGGKRGLFKLKQAASK